MKRRLAVLLLATWIAAEAAAQQHVEITLPKTGDGLTPKVRVDMVRSDIVRVRRTMDGPFIDSNPTTVCNYDNSRWPKVKIHHVGNLYRLTTDSLRVDVDARSGAVSCYDRRSGRLLGREDVTIPCQAERTVSERVTFDESTRRTVMTADGEKEIVDVAKRDTVGTSWKWQLNWRLTASEGVYGWGSHIEDYMNLNGKTMWLCQHNLKAMVPVINSTNGYGLLIDAGSEMIWRGDGTIEVGAAPQLDYYIMKGATMDKTVACYRWLTGTVPMLPRYAFGYIQSKERYVSSADLIGTLTQFRQRHIPIDMIVQDWNYWPQGSWGYMLMNSHDYPNKRALSDSIHAMNARLMISIWPTFSNSPQTDDFTNRGLMIEGTNAYDAFSAAGRDLYWQYAQKEFFDNGFDAWWCDSSEPLDADWNNRGPAYTENSHEERWQLCSHRLADALGHERSQLYSLFHSKGIYEHQRAVSDRKRVLNLTRSTYAGQQRYSTVVWNGDTYASWRSFAKMIPAGLNYMSTGNPWWTVDAGAFFVKKGWAWFYAGEYEQGVKDAGYRELYTRMLQYATFLPMMRSHGTDTPREPWRFEEFYESILKTIRLRYSLLPYTYSLAAQVSRNDGTMTRPLAFDFAGDAKVFDLKDEFLFGDAFLVAPVTRPLSEATTREVYLPKGAIWYDYWTGQKLTGGQSITADTPIDHIPLFVKAGSIVPLCADSIEHSGSLEDATWEIRVWPGSDGQFTIYEDAGDNYDYEQGAYSLIRLTWNDRRQELTIHRREGSYMPSNNKKTLRIRMAGTDRIREVSYGGKQLVVKL